MIAFSLLLLAGFLFPSSPVLGAVALAFAFWAATYWSATIGEGLEMIVFYGALAGCITAWAL